MPRPLNSEQRKKLRQAQNMVEEKAASLSLPIEILARKRYLIALYLNIIKAQQEPVDNIEIPEELLGWRKQVLLNDLLEILT